MSHTLILLRHGESTWNKENLFTGWTDVDLSPKGEEEARAAGKLLIDADLDPDVLHTSLLKRAIRTSNIALEVMDRLWIPVKRSWRLNERHYGALQGLNKKETAERYGKDQVFQWRRSYDIPPPPLETDDPRHPRHDPRCRHLPPDALPACESLKDVVARMMPWWQDGIVPDLRDRKTVLVSAHGNSLRALVKHLDGIPDEEIPELNIPTGIPLIYELDDGLKPLARGGRYLGNAEAARASAEAVARQAG